MEISIVLPAHNEEKNLPVLIPAIIGHMRETSHSYEIIVVDDGSTDGTREVLSRLAKGIPLRIVSHLVNRGYGAALRSGFTVATKSWVFFTDSDCQFDFSEIDLLIGFTESADIVAGYRADRKDNTLRRFNAWLFNFAMRILFGVKARDIDCAFKLIKREVIESAHLESNGAFINSELLIRAKQQGYRVREVAVSHFRRTRGGQSGANFRVIVRAIKEVLRFRLTGRV